MDKDIILFDLDGTLSDPKEGITGAVRHSLVDFGINAKMEELVCFIGPPLRESYKRLFGFDDAKTEAAIEKYREYFSDRGIFENALYCGIEGLLSELKGAGKLLALATTKPALYASRILEHFGIAEYFDFVSGSEMDGSRSDKAELILHALSNLPPVSYDKVIMVGDRDLDIFGAKAMGIESIGVLYGYGGKGELETAGATYLAKSVEALRGLLLLL